MHRHAISFSYSKVALSAEFRGFRDRKTPGFSVAAIHSELDTMTPWHRTQAFTSIQGKNSVHYHLK